jgi:flagellar L-ring protein precursor FlgH
MFQFKQYFIFGVCIAISHCAFATSLYEESNYKALYEDKKAFSTGDGITILIYENTKAVTSAGEGSSGDMSFSGGASVDERHWNGGLKLGSSNNGDAATNRNGFVRAQLTAVVIGRDDHGALLIEGVQKITINEEEQIIRVKGKVRIEDISSLNTVASYRIQNAEISIDGEGEVSAGKNGNVFTRLVRWMGL